MKRRKLEHRLSEWFVLTPSLEHQHILLSRTVRVMSLERDRQNALLEAVSFKASSVRLSSGSLTKTEVVQRAPFQRKRGISWSTGFQAEYFRIRDCGAKDLVSTGHWLATGFVDIDARLTVDLRSLKFHPKKFCILAGLQPAMVFCQQNNFTLWRHKQRHRAPPWSYWQ